ncbi:hypothetical protein [uncultured Nostoc sp.]|uniref:hypothetical protein n=1 Tax=uncultured Nostoc sp. TaxID=340711 RepID=UPI0035CAA645
MTQNSSKIPGKFYPLQHEEWLYACWELTQAQRDVLDDRIHLFERSDLAKLALAQATCLEFRITVTFEEVQP